MEQIQVQKARRRAIDMATAVLAGRISGVVGAIELNVLRAAVDVPDDDPDFETFVLIDSECEALPFGRVRQYWSEEALSRKQPDVERAERWAMETGREAFENVVSRFAAAAMSEDDVIAFLAAEDRRRVFLFRFSDGTEAELTDPWVHVVEGGKRECLATVVREAAGIKVEAGSELCFALSDVADVRLSPKDVEYVR